jgi:hypothetical protein
MRYILPRKAKTPLVFWKASDQSSVLSFGKPLGIAGKLYFKFTFAFVFAKAEMLLQHSESKRAVQVSAYAAFFYIRFYFQKSHLHSIAETFVHFQVFELPLRYTESKAKPRKRVRSGSALGADMATVILLAGSAGGCVNYRAVALLKILCGSLGKSGGIGKYFFVFLQY